MDDVDDGDDGDDGDLDRVRIALVTKRQELESELATLTAPTDGNEGISFGKRVGDGTSMAVERLSQVAAHARLQQLLADVVRAQEKVEEGSSGVCDVCGRPVAPARLEALPWATLCIDDAARR